MKIELIEWFTASNAFMLIRFKNQLSYLNEDFTNSLYSEKEFIDNFNEKININ